ncbi:MAG TPA: cupin domain-containing protein [Thioalkalivibrio sp.]|nr:cupin domain-containing protein [Thioalkalivibrio sp.]
MKPEVIHPVEAGEYWFREGCHILEIHNHEDDPALSIARARLEPGRRTRRHVLDGVAERYLIVAGAGRVTVGDLPPEPVAAGDVVVIPPGVMQSIENTDSADLVFHALCTPRFTPGCYRDVEDEVKDG